VNGPECDANPSAREDGGMTERSGEHGAAARPHRSRFGLLAASAVFLASLGLLVSGSPLLLLMLSARMGLPLGTAVTWFGMLAWGALLHFGSVALPDPAPRADRFYRGSWRVALTLALLWPLAGFGLAGNWAYTFSDTDGFRGGQAAMQLFWVNSVVVVALPPAIWLARFVHRRIALARGRPGVD